MTRTATVLLILFAFCCKVLHAQQDRLVLRFADASTKLPLIKVSLIDKTGSLLAISDSSGYAIVPMNRFSLPGSIIAMREGFKPDTLRAGQTMVYLQPLSAELPAATINSSKTHKVFRYASEYVVNYEFWDDDLLITSYSGGNGRNAKIFLLSRNEEVVNRCDLPTEPLALLRSCTGNYYCVSFNEFYPIARDGKKINLQQPYSTKLLTGLQQCEQCIDGNLFYRIGDRLNFRMTYAMIRKGDSVLRPIIEFEEKEVAQASLNEYFEIQALLAAGNFKDAGRKANLRRLWDKGSYAHISMPIFRRDDTLMVFDFFNKAIQLYDKQGTTAGSCAIKCRWPALQQFEILADDATNKFYLHHFSNPARQTIEELNVYTGLAGSTTVVAHPFAEKVKVHNGKIYFLWQDGPGGTTRQIYSQGMDN